MNHIEYAKLVMDHHAANIRAIDHMQVSGTMAERGRWVADLRRAVYADLELAQLVRRHMKEQGITFGWDDGTITIEGIHDKDGKTDYIRLAENFTDLDAAVQYASIHPETKEKR